MNLSLNHIAYDFKINLTNRRGVEVMDIDEEINRERDIRLKDIQLEENKDFKYITIGLNAYALHDGVDTKVGEAIILIYDENWGNVVEFADEYSAERFEAITSVCFKDCEREYDFLPIDKPKEYFNRVSVYGRLAIINNFTIHQLFQNQGFGTEFMKELIAFLNHIMNVNFVLLQAHPYLSSLPHQEELLSEEQRKENIKYIERQKERLSKFYKQKFGFKSTGNPELNFLVRKTNSIKHSGYYENVFQ
jgi:GNAT superfamily N-acetyltransferase